MAVEFRLLGDIEASIDSRQVPIGYTRLRCVLAILLMDVNRTVTVDQILDRVWGTRPLPRRPRAAVQHSIALLRRALATAEDAMITRQSNGYQLTADAQTIDVHRFESLLDDARTVDEDDLAAALYDRAIQRWRGDPFAGVDTPWLHSMRSALTARRYAAQLDLTDAQLRLGRHAELLATLETQSERHPLDERLAGQCLIALYRSGRQAQALEHYERIRQRLADQLGADPSPPLQRLHQQVLVADPTLAAPTVRSTVRVSSAPVPHQLPASPRLFVGRDGELAVLTTVLDQHTAAANAVMICVIGGVGGVGKTSLALHWAHQQLNRFPDGQLHVNLRGFDPSGEPLSPTVAVRGFLDALGVGPAAIPHDLDAQVGLYRSLVAGRRMLIVLDNARDSNQIIPLLPGGRDCAVLVTSRCHLPSLIAGYGARVIKLDVLSTAKARELLACHLGVDRPRSDPGLMAELIDGCAGLPLAIGIVAARAASHPRFPLAALAEGLRDHTRRLDTLDGGELTANVRTVLSWSSEALSADAGTVFNLLGLFPGPDISVAAAASLAALPVDKIRVVLRDLENASLVQQHPPDRYRLHDLVRLYAADQAHHDQTDLFNDDALRRLIDFYLHTAYHAQRLLQPLIPPIRIGEPAAGCQPCLLDDCAAALAWFTAEYHNLVAAQQLAATRGWTASVWRLAWVMTTFLYRQGRFLDALAAWRAGEAAAGELDDGAIRVRTHQLLGSIFAELGRHNEALHYLTLAMRGSDVGSDAYTQHALGWHWSLRGDNRRALTHAADALRLYRASEMPAGETRELTVTGWYLAQLGENDQARAQCEAGLTLARRHGYVEDEGLTLGILGYVAYQAGQHVLALKYLRQARRLLKDVGNTYYEATTLDYLGRTQQAVGRVKAALHALRQALQLYQAQNRIADAARTRERVIFLAASYP